MPDLATVRTEVKAWERDFRSRYGRDPSVQDIRDQPLIAERYKLYKKLSRASVSVQPAAGSSANTTPLRTQSTSSRAGPIPKSRPAETVNPLPGFNPFSPVKSKGKHKDTSRAFASQASRDPPSANPSVTPVGNKSRPQPRIRTPSPDPFPFILPPQPKGSSSSSNDRQSNSAVLRARKRLRGEPVSPSPNKPKRQRVRSQAILPLPSLEPTSDSGDEPDERSAAQDSSSSFVDDSPAKAPAGGKLFKLLFDDSLPVLSLHKKSNESSTSQLNGPTLDAYFVSMASHFRTSAKRPLDGGGPAPENMQLAAALHAKHSLIPPSPPPEDPVSRAKGKAVTSRKKAKFEEEGSEEDQDSPGDVDIKVVTVTRSQGKGLRQSADDLDWDPLLDRGARNHDPDAKGKSDANHHNESDTFSVDLPDELRRMLAISPSRSRSNIEERVVRGLLYGDRVGHYDPSRGGDIWDVGEGHESVRGDAEAEDDWESEPVPWEVGEL
ncbi:hypothetical protein PAXRUDRAFT_129532 [Paxillus rubicundulus Ve08.2h10]|uniref:DNA replication regulator SLD2 n=1 Tax=Paxillus rubicundulus Ve08.2h10 TaxID=930991 RepID=A0A0D0ED61_9AGAM|nr:hypothetical protein PAXRUDRAFT_129532 [Paxillus rubicundulus Ve08.2h10]